jgi:hypothetical protein
MFGGNAQTSQPAPAASTVVAPKPLPAPHFG